MATIVVDFDDVLGDVITHWTAAYNQAYNDNVQFTCWDMHTQVKPECGRGIYKLRTPEMYELVQPYPGVVEGCAALGADGHRLVCLTSDTEPFLQAKTAWLERWTPNAFSEIYICGPGDKGAAIEELGGQYVIDDHLKNLLGLRPGIKRFLMTRPHNLSTRVPASVQRVTEFWEFVAQVRSYEKALSLG